MSSESEPTFEQEVLYMVKRRANYIGEKINHTKFKDFYEVIEIELQDTITELEKLRKDKSPEYKKAREIAVNFIGYPIDVEDEKYIENATPLQALEALDKRVRELLDTHHKEFNQDAKRSESNT